MTARPWRRLDPTDAYFAYDIDRVLVGVDLPGIDALRAALAAYATVNPAVFRVVDRRTARWRAFTQDELRTASRDLVAECALSDPRAALEALAAPLVVGPSLRIVLGPGWLALKTAHEALYDGMSTYLLLQSLLGAAPPRRVRVTGTAARDGMLAGYLAGHPAAVRAAFAHQSRLSAAPRRPAPPLPAEGPVSTHADGGPEVADRLRELRAQRWPAASLSALVQVGIRAELSRAGIPVARGTEVLFDVRRYFPGARPLFGNWSAGLHLAPEDDLDPEAVAIGVRGAVASGLPVAAMAAGRVLGRRNRATLLHRPVPGPAGQARLTFTHLSAKSEVRHVPYSAGAPVRVLTRTRPANAEALTVVVEEVGGRFSLSASHYDAVWPAASVAAALEAFLRDPAAAVGGTDLPVEPGQVAP